MCSGREFQMWAAATGKARLPTVARLTGCLNLRIRSTCLVACVGGSVCVVRTQHVGGERARLVHDPRLHHPHHRLPLVHARLSAADTLLLQRLHEKLQPARSRYDNKCAPPAMRPRQHCPESFWPHICLQRAPFPEKKLHYTFVVAR